MTISVGSLYSPRVKLTAISAVFVSQYAAARVCHPGRPRRDLVRADIHFAASVIDGFGGACHPRLFRALYERKGAVRCAEPLLGASRPWLTSRSKPMVGFRVCDAQLRNAAREVRLRGLSLIQGE